MADSDRVRLTEQDLIEALLQAQALQEDNAITVLEIGQQTELSGETIRKRLRQLQQDGRLTCVRVRRYTLDGRLTWAPAYRLAGGGECTGQ